MVITRTIYGLGWRFPEISNMEIIPCEPLLHIYTRYNFHIGNLWKSPTESINRTSYYHIDMVEPDKYINDVDQLKHILAIKDE